MLYKMCINKYLYDYNYVMHLLLLLFINNNNNNNNNTKYIT